MDTHTQTNYCNPRCACAPRVTVVKKDRGKLMATCLEHQSTKNAANIATYTSWLKLWDSGFRAGGIRGHAEFV